MRALSFALGWIPPAMIHRPTTPRTIGRFTIVLIAARVMQFTGHDPACPNITTSDGDEEAL
jgi:hypothetical protein